MILIIEILIIKLVLELPNTSFCFFYNILVGVLPLHPHSHGPSSQTVPAQLLQQ